MASEIILETRGVTKKFPGVTALRNVSFTLRRGEVHALCGENGAGKSTLIKLLSGIHQCGSYEGEYSIDGKPATFASIRDAERNGIAVIYQELALVEEMTVAQNIFLGNEPVSCGMIDWHAMFTKARDLLAKFKLPIDPSAKVGALGVGHKQLVEIVKALGKKSRILILDEPTAALTETEVDILLDIIKDLRAQGISCVYISHKLDEVMRIADRITVLRDGETITTMAIQTASIPAIIRHMVGREINNLFPRHAQGASEKLLLEVDNLSVAESEDDEKLCLQGISFSLHGGEVLGIGGLMGAGRSELLMHIFGMYGHRRSGGVRLIGEDFAKPTPSEALRRGLAFVTEDRKRYGLHLDQSIGFNMSLSSLDKVTRMSVIDEYREVMRNKECFDSLKVKAPNLEAAVKGLSGGNQQKVVIGKILMTEPKVVFLDEPTRGIDVGAKLEVYQLINRLTSEGKAVVIVSSELPELMGMSDRIVMLCEGRIGGVFSKEEATQEKLMTAAMGRQQPG